MVLQVQQWLNQIYGSNPAYERVQEDGITGWGTIRSLIRALQIEENIPAPNGNFGPATKAACPTLSINTDYSKQKVQNEICILQGALYCKGYGPGGFTGQFKEGTRDAVKKFQSDAGLANPDGVATPMIFEALLNMDAFVNLGDAKIRTIQQNLNRDYSKVIGLMPCDGIYSRSTNKALIYALQIEEGIAEPNGTFGPSTKSLCPTLSVGNSKTKFNLILQYALYCNHYDPNGFDGQYGSGMKAAVAAFQKFAALPSDGIAGMQTFASLLVSTGDNTRKGTACDCAKTVTPEKAATLKANGYKIVGRYLTGPYKMTASELKTIFSQGLSVFPIYERAATKVDYFTSSQGKTDASNAVAAAIDFGFSSGTIIYFAVDYDAVDSEVTSNIIPYFEGVKKQFNRFNPKQYKIGIYGPRNVCSRVAKAGYSSSSFVCDMSTGFSGNLGYTLPTDWAFDQIATKTIGSGTGAIEIDNNIASGKNTGASSVNPNSGVDDSFVTTENQKFFNQVDILYNTAVKLATVYADVNNKSDEVTHIANQLVAQYLRKDSYDGAMWIGTAGPIDEAFVDNANTALNNEPINLLVDPKTKTEIDTEHLMATFNTIIYSPLQVFIDYAGWAGDLVTLTKDMQNHSDNYSTLYDAAKDLIGNRNTDSITSFSEADLIGDVDAMNLASNSGTGSTAKPINNVVRSYYTSGYTTRFTQFLKNGFSNSFTTLYDKAEDSLNSNSPDKIAFQLALKKKFDIPDYSEELGQEAAKGFRDVVKDKMATE